MASRSSWATTRCLAVLAFRPQGLSQRKIANALNHLGITTPHGGLWRLSQVHGIISRLEENVKEETQF
ncbi:TPA: recombinase family protein [Klebsiella pneumoniae]